MKEGLFDEELNNIEQEETQQVKTSIGIKFGWIQGVLVCRCHNALKLNSEPKEKKQHALTYDI